MKDPARRLRLRGAVGRAEAVYRRRDPEQSVLYQVVREHILGFFEYAESRSADGRGLPRYVRQEFLRYLKCGILAHGFIRVRCPDCGHDAVVAFSCKNRGICPSCAGRRMADTAADLVDHVFPRAPVRQWVLSLPREVRYVLAREARLITGVVKIFMEEIFRDLKRRAKERFKGKFFPGAVTSVQRYGGSLNLNVHLHSLVLDGVFVEEAGAKRMRFRRLPEPTKDDLDGVLSRVRHRALEYLGKEGYAVGPGDGEREDVPEDGILGAIQGASVLEWAGLSGEARRVEVEGRFPDGYRVGREEGPFTVSSGDGWNLEAGVRICGGDREGLEKLCRYVLRPPFAEDRLERLPDGRVRYEFRRPRADGGTHLVLEPYEFLAKLAALVPPPRSHLVRYHGVLGPHAVIDRGIVHHVLPG